MPQHGRVSVAALACMAGVVPADGALIDVIVDGRVISNDVRVGRYAGVPVGTPVRFTARVDTTDVFSHEPQNFTTWYHAEYGLATFGVAGVPLVQGRHEEVASDSVVIFAGGDVYYQVEVPSIYLRLPEVTLLHCQFDGQGANPFNNTGHLEDNLGVYPADVFDGLRYFRLSVAHVGPPLVFRDLFIEAATFTILDGSCPADFSADGSVNSQDVLDYLGAFFAQDPDADFNRDASVNSQDFFEFVAAFFAGCE